MLVALAATLLAMGRWPRLGRRHLELFTAVAVLGAVLPGYFSYATASELPAGVRAIVLAIVPMFALPIALAAGFERPDAFRAAGVICGAAAIMLIGFLDAGAGGPIQLGLLLIALITPLSYGLEANYLAWRGTLGLSPFEVMLGASAVGIVLTLPLAWQSDQLVDLARPWGAPEWALAAVSVLNALAYSGYVWLVGRAGAVFTSQVAYVVTGCGVVWSIVLLAERYSPGVWAALALMIVGLALVQPRRRLAAGGVPQP
jgi:drug/metabolite transporter (DMT)-like permease